MSVGTEMAVIARREIDQDECDAICSRMRSLFGAQRISTDNPRLYIQDMIEHWGGCLRPNDGETLIEVWVGCRYNEDVAFVLFLAEWLEREIPGRVYYGSENGALELFGKGAREALWASVFETCYVLEGDSP